ncbi:Disease resistance-like protein DSC1 [Vitis vinifera]|uniref:Disease resistance-like protein DSC1 n=1 Tax=Vitis vinifera TaxID=29760 RepID=A0A438ECN1_VITVI|nr:Disease resistance-like protein DSC1 [Vitis vinifera]
MNKLNQFKDCKLLLSGDFKSLSNNLRCLYWHGYPLKSLPLNFHPEQLVELNMSYSRVEQLWKGLKMYQQLKFVKLSYSQHLIETPDFSGAPNLRRLILEGCTSLSKVHPSTGDLNKLVFLNLEGCENLKSFLRSICMESLQNSYSLGCSNSRSFQRSKGA